jgi:hypothetical protein
MQLGHFLSASRVRGDPGSALPAHKELDEPFPCMILEEDNDLLLLLLWNENNVVAKMT